MNRDHPTERLAYYLSAIGLAVIAICALIQFWSTK